VKSYSQYCPVAHSLGLVGERWALLVVRELLHGPKRYTDLVAGLPGIGTNILAARLKDLEAGGILEKRRLPPPAASTVYELTEFGRELRPVLHELARWGARSLGPPAPDDLHEGWLQQAIELALSASVQHGRIAFRVGEEEASLVDGRVVAGVLEDPDVFVETDERGFYELVVERRLDAARVEGDGELLQRLIDGFAPSPLPA
jgi:DNA-binding HxlR family transcriptional regulator